MGEYKRSCSTSLQKINDLQCSVYCNAGELITTCFFLCKFDPNLILKLTMNGFYYKKMLMLALKHANDKANFLFY